MSDIDKNRIRQVKIKGSNSTILIIKINQLLTIIIVLFLINEKDQEELKLQLKSENCHPIENIMVLCHQQYNESNVPKVA